MRQLNRLLRYAVPYWWQVLLSVILMAAVGLLDGFRVLLIGPVLDRVLNPASQSANIVCSDSRIRITRFTCSSSFPNISIMPGPSSPSRSCRRPC